MIRVDNCCGCDLRTGCLLYAGYSIFGVGVTFIGLGAVALQGENSYRFHRKGVNEMYMSKGPYLTMVAFLMITGIFVVVSNLLLIRALIQKLKEHLIWSLLSQFGIAIFTVIVAILICVSNFIGGAVMYLLSFLLVILTLGIQAFGCIAIWSYYCELREKCVRPEPSLRSKRTYDLNVVASAKSVADTV